MVLDASAVVEWLLRHPLASAVSERLVAADALHAPHLLADVIHHPHEPLLPVMWRLRSNLTAYDAAYVAVAEVLDRPLVTLDATLARAPGHGAVVDLVAPAVPPASVR
jgi:predicted nucleic acid-binding protein